MLQHHEKALEISRELARAQPENQAHTRVMAGLLYNIASALSQGWAAQKMLSLLSRRVSRNTSS
jgi:hypothetical protein